MPFENLRDIANAFNTYLEDVVDVTISPLTLFNGPTLNRTEGFRFSVDATNGTIDTGVRLTNVRLLLGIMNQAIARIRVPEISGATITSTSSGMVVSAGAYVPSMIINFPVGHAWAQIEPGENVPSLSFEGRAIIQGSTLIFARILANIDLAPDQTSDAANRTIIVT